MRKKLSNQIVFITALIYIGLLAGCTTTEEISANREISNADNKYNTEFPGKDLPKELEYISKTVKKLDCLAFYMTYVFPSVNNLKMNSLSDSVLRNLSINNSVNNQSVSGTAMVIYNDGKRLGLLTCAHVIDFPDTIITRYENGKGAIQSVSVKIRQQNFVRDLPAGSDIKILAKDINDDIAFIGKTLDNEGVYQAVLNYPAGNTKDLQWGSEVYVMGYPIGNLMVTRAIVSDPDKADKGRFLTDAMYNRGISGSPVFAIRDGLPNFELVGMASSASAKQIYYVKPGKEEPEYINPEVPYTGDLYVDSYKDIKYGVTFNVSIEGINAFLKDNKNVLQKEGFDPNRFFK